MSKRDRNVCVTQMIFFQGREESHRDDDTTHMFTERSTGSCLLFQLISRLSLRDTSCEYSLEDDERGQKKKRRGRGLLHKRTCV